MASAPLTRQALRWAAGELAARRPIVSDVRVLPWSVSARLEVGGVGYWVKVGPPATSAVEKRILTVAGKLGMPVPVLVTTSDELNALLLREVPTTPGRPEFADVMAAKERVRTALAEHLDRLDLSPLTAAGCARKCADLRSGWIDDATTRALAAAIDDCGPELAAVDRSLTGPVGVVHGDFHPGNVLLSANGPVLIDWSDAMVGAQAWDLATYTQAEDTVLGVLTGLKGVTDFLSTPLPVDGEVYSLSIPRLREHIRSRAVALAQALHALRLDETSIAQ
jgi:Phosphotransferase enzyme family